MSRKRDKDPPRPRHTHAMTPAELRAENARSRREIRAAFAEGPCYGLAEWAGSRTTGGWGRGRHGFRHLVLEFGDPRAAEPSVTVLTVVADRFDVRVGELRARTAGALGEGSREFEQMAREPAEEIMFDVADEPVAFRLWGGDACSVAAALLGARGIALAIRGVPLEAIRLVRVTDVGPFLAVGPPR